uniref:Short transient receptor potential channel 4-associated protein n=1 Tax=Oncorhynchus tshawytscha TaxID=74940 RepID=A0A8C8J880_ONCTS
MATLLGLESPWTGGKRSVRNGNIIAKIRHSQIVGRGFSRGTQLPEALLRERDRQAKWHSIPELLQELHESSHPNSNLSHTHGVLKELSSLLSMEAMSFVTEDRKSAQESTFPITYTFDLFGGVDLIVEILMRPTLTMQKKKPKMNDALVKDCLSVLYNCCICVSTLAAEHHFVKKRNNKTFLQTAALIEDILGVKKGLLTGLVQSFNQQQLANFCRILSVTVSEPDLGNDDKHTLLAKNAQQKQDSSLSCAEVNQVTLLNIPGFIERLCKLATRKVSGATGASNFPQEVEDWYMWLDKALVLDAVMQMATEEAEHTSTESSDKSLLATSTLSPLAPVHEIMYKVEVLYVLCVLLMGSHRNQVHKMLAEFRLIPGLNNLFDKLIWRKYTLSNHVVHGQNENCDCSPEISFKIQFLRLLQSFSDHHDAKEALCSLNSNEILYCVSHKCPLPVSLCSCRSLVCDGEKGLLTRLLTVMKKEPLDSSFRFWQARAVESFLRGATSYADQMFLLKRGLLENMLFCIIYSGCKSKDVLQSYFDLLGELMKFNIDAFKRFNIYVSTDNKFQTFMSQINSSLMDSNMLVRCIILSLDRFETQTEDRKVVEVLSECCLLSYLAKVENRLSFLFRRVNIINVQTLTHCLNTSLVVLMLAGRREKYPGCLLNNFHNLLRFWQRHYLNRDKDSTCLENSSCIPFSYWNETVSVLLRSDRTSVCAIASYIDEPFMDLLEC